MNRQRLFLMIGLFFVVGLALGLLSTGTASAQTKVEICDNKIDDDGDGLVDLDDPDCKKPPPPNGVPCSPGFWKNHPEDFNQFCEAAAGLTTEARLDSCTDLLVALTCKGSDASCLRSAAAALLNTVSGCEE
jgi:hypothetical protein